MKKKIISILMLIMALFMVTACGEKKEEEKTNSMEENTTTKVYEKDDDGIITSGEVENYKFTVVDEETDRVAIQMESGDTMLIVLSNEDTPITIANFKKLVSEHFYDGLVFHRIMADFMIQGGAANNKTVKTIKGEFKTNGVENKLSHTRGVISMARANDPDSASSQFFIMHAANSSLDGRYAAFGKLFAGYNVLDKIAGVEVVDNGLGEKSTPVKPPVIKSIRFVNVEKVS